jgi:hypothetical protein
MRRAEVRIVSSKSSLLEEEAAHEALKIAQPACAGLSSALAADQAQIFMHPSPTQEALICFALNRLTTHPISFELHCLNYYLSNKHCMTQLASCGFIARRQSPVN